MIEPQKRSTPAPVRRVLPLARMMDEAFEGLCGGDLQGFVDALAPPPGRAATRPSLIIEEDPDDAFLLLRSLSAASSRGDVRIVDCLPDARRVLQDPRYVPALVILSISPRIRDVGAFLEWVRAQPRLRKVPILALLGALPPASPRSQPLDAPGLYWLVKPTEHERLASAIQTLLQEASEFRSL